MRKRIVWLLALITALLIGVIAPFLDKQFGLTDPARVVLTLAALASVVTLGLIVEFGPSVPGRHWLHRLLYLHTLSRSPSLAQWATRFATLHLGRGPRYVNSAEVLERGARRDLVEFLFEAVVKRGESGRRILILGEPGSGKSTALERLVLELANYSIRWFGFRGPIPVLIRAGDHRDGDDLPSLVKHSLQQATHGRTRRNLLDPDAVQQLLENPRLIIVCDGLDELSGRRLESVLAALGTPARDAGLAHLAVICTCRTRQDPGGALPDYETFALLDLSDDAVVEFIEIYADDERVRPEDIYGHLTTGQFLEPGGLGRNAFWLRELIRSGTQERTRSQILSVASSKALNWEWEKQPRAERRWKRPAAYINIQEQFVDECHRALGKVATELGSSRFKERDEIRKGLAPWLQERGRVLALPSLVPDNVLEFARDAGILDRDPEKVRFSHRIIQEFYAARALWVGDASLHDDVLRYSREPGYWQTLAMYTGMLPRGDRDRFVEMILDSDPSAMGLACAIAAYVGDHLWAEEIVNPRLLLSLRTGLASGAELDSQLATSLQQFLRTGYDVAANFLGLLLADPRPTVRTRVCALLAYSEASEAVRLLAYAGLDDRDE